MKHFIVSKGNQKLRQFLPHSKRFTLHQRSQSALIESLKLTLLYHRELLLAIQRLLQTQNNVVKYYILQFACKI